MTDAQVSADAIDKAEPAMEPLDVLIVLPHLGPGGAQKVATYLAHHWAARGLRVGLLTTLPSPPDAHRLGNEVTRLCLESGARRQDERPVAMPARSTWLGTAVRTTSYSALAAYAAAADAFMLVTSADSQSYKGRLSRLSEWRASALRVLEQECAEIQSLSTARTIMARNADRLLVRLGAKLGVYRPTLNRNERRAIESWSATEAHALRMLGRSQRRRIFAIRDVITATRPGRVIAFLSQTNICTILATRGLDVPVIVSERNDPGKQRMAPPWERLRKIVYPMADIVSANTQGAVDSLAQFVPGDRLRCVPNPLDVPEIDPNAGRYPRFICAARLVPQKGIDVAIEAFARIASAIPDWELHILGDGPLRSSLEERVESLGLAHRVYMHGFVTDPVRHFLEASVFVLPSRFEGMPNALLEAMACELPAVVTNASPGPLEFIKHEATGLVVDVDDVEGLAAAMLRMGTGEVNIKDFATKAKSLLDQVAAQRACSIWDEVVGLNKPEG